MSSIVKQFRLSREIVALLLCLLFYLQSSNGFTSCDFFLTAAFQHQTYRAKKSKSTTVFSSRFVEKGLSMTTTDSMDTTKILSRILYRTPTPQDIRRCHEIEAASYPPDEAASLERLQYRQKHAEKYFQLCTIPATIPGEETIVGFVCSTRCTSFTEDSMSTHNPKGRLLAVHSVVVEERFRNCGIAKAMLRHYIQSIQEQQQHPQQYSTIEDDDKTSFIESIVLLAKSHLLGFYVQCGFQVKRPSPIVHGKELWYELEQSCLRTVPRDRESWFCKTEQFKRPYPEVKPYLNQHKLWIQRLRAQGHCITSGYRVDAEGKPGGGGLLFLAAKSYQDALDLVLQDPLVANDCVTWELNGWIGQVGDIQIR
jgi:uncharacterized protein YciI/ribosomal protein S18 acetylase RimI-like enzyme